MRFSKVFTAAMAVSMPVSIIATGTQAHAALAPRQDDSSILSEILNLFNELKDFLDPTFLDNVQITINGLATILADPLPNNTRSLILSAEDALSGVDIGSLLSDVGPLVSSLSKIDLSSLVSAVSGLLTTGNVQILQNLLTNANNLLTTNFVNETTTLINDVAPLVDAVSQFVTALISALLGG
ncbi:hypothetical protein BX600DRAFT_538512 [Xylariales sp. PMI_506]|nr:hypothetical protein BX600DRAFT_538512 [Xylariales sp. PMI_506]